MEEEQYYRKLIKRYTERTATDAELEVFIHLLNEGKLDTFLNEAFEQDADIIEDDEQFLSASKSKKQLFPRIAAAASIIMILAAGGYFLLKNKESTQQVANTGSDVKPGSNGAILTLANGRKVVLEQAKPGIITKGIKKLNDSLLSYNSEQPYGINTLETPKGRQYSVILPDGTKVWLNAASTLKYPTRFDKERLVELHGEAYFEVVHNAKSPFRVKSGKQITEDIGTSFNINNYDDEKTAVTTLIEGSISVNQRILKPGEAAFIDNNGGLTLREVEISTPIAWKNGFFSFRKASVDEVMRQFARWYNAEVIYESGIPEGSITGSVYRNVNASQALDILKYLDIHYRIEGKKIIITHK